MEEQVMYRRCWRRPVRGYELKRLTAAPILIDVSKSDSTRTSPSRSRRPIAASAADAKQPQLAQSGAPPNWHGVIRVAKSADMVVVVRANRHFCGDSGGDAKASRTPCGISSFW